MAPSTDPFILIVEDDPDHSALIEAAFKKSLAHAKTHFGAQWLGGSGVPC